MFSKKEKVSGEKEVEQNEKKGVAKPPVLFSDTQNLISTIEKRLNAPLITYYNSNAGNVCGNDASAMYEILKGKKIDTAYLFIKSDGGSGIAALRIISTLRNYCKNLIALIPSNCASAATMMALGANEIVMGPLAYLTPVDTSLKHELSPTNKGNELVSVSMDELSRVVKLWKEQDLLFQDEGELQCTDYGISGIIVFQMSRLVHTLLQDKAKFSLELSFLPKFGEEEAKDYFLERKTLLEKERGEDFLLGLFPEKLSQVLYERTAFPLKQKIQDISDQKILELCQLCLHFPFHPERIGDFQRAQCTAGGVNLSEIFIPDFQSKKNPDLYFAGEILDVDGICGGYNLHFAFGSGILAGRAMGKKND